jgi:hypothetical protein
MSLMERFAEYEREHQFLRLHTFPEEDRHRYTSATWAGEYRWFRSPNIVCLERVRALLARNERREFYGGKGQSGFDVRLARARWP